MSWITSKILVVKVDICCHIVVITDIWSKTWMTRTTYIHMGSLSGIRPSSPTLIQLHHSLRYHQFWMCSSILDIDRSSMRPKPNNCGRIRSSQPMQKQVWKSVTRQHFTWRRTFRNFMNRRWVRICAIWFHGTFSTSICGHADRLSSIVSRSKEVICDTISRQTSFVRFRWDRRRWRRLVFWVKLTQSRRSSERQGWMMSPNNILRWTYRCPWTSDQGGVWRAPKTSTQSERHPSLRPQSKIYGDFWEEGTALQKETKS